MTEKDVPFYIPCILFCIRVQKIIEYTNDKIIYLFIFIYLRDKNS